MSKFKRRDSRKSVQSVVLRNTGQTVKQLDEPLKDGYIFNLKESVSYFKKICKGEVVTIVGDYDADGITAAAILKLALKAYGIDPVVRLPRRFSEGYGLSEKIIDEIDSGVIITVDNGIAAIDAILKAKRKGIKVIVLDHHLTKKDENEKPILPVADIICDPAAENRSDFHHYCGAGIAYRFAKELIPKKERVLNNLLVLASIGTVADVMPLVGENRYIVREGLRLVNTKRGGFGVQSILKSLEIDKGVTESTYGFKIGPIINASERMNDGGAEKVLDVLAADDKDFKVPFKVGNLVAKNDERKELTSKIMNSIESKIGDERPIIIYDPEISEGLIGLIAGRIAEDRQCPVIIFTDIHGSEGLIKGSGRSGGVAHLANALKNIQHLIVGWGGHEGAAGLSIKLEDLETFKTAFANEIGELPAMSEKVHYDLELDAVDFASTMEELDRFAPYGAGNPPIVFRIKLDTELMTYMGASEDHISIKKSKCDVLGFNLGDKFKSLGKPKKIAAIGTFDTSHFRGNVKKTFMMTNFEEA